MIRSYDLKIRLTDLERRRLEHAAKQLETTVTDVLRTGGLKIADRFPLPAAPGDFPPLRKNASIDARIERTRERARFKEAQQTPTAQPQPEPARKPPMSNRGTPEQRAEREAKRLKEEADNLEMARIVREMHEEGLNRQLPDVDAYGVVTYPDGSTYNKYTGLWTEPTIQEGDDEETADALDPWTIPASPGDPEPLNQVDTLNIPPLNIISPNPTYAEEPQTECFYCDSPEITLMGQTVNGSDWYQCRSCNRIF